MLMKKAMTVLLLAALLLTPLIASAGGYTNFPRTAIAYMVINYRCGCSRIGTGAMVCSNGLITAGHNLICAEHSKSARDIVFYFGYMSKNDYFYKYDGSLNYWYYDSFSDGYSGDNDIGYVRFSSNVGDHTGWFATRYAGDSEFDGVSCRIGAYTSAGKLTLHSATLSVDSDKQFTFNKKELPYGGEGAPIYILRGSSKDPTIVGVYTSHRSSVCCGRRLTKQVFNDMCDDLNVVVS
ncbi:MAG: hypothetical protein IJ174_04130, partial [Clostridia bacterium]|nr:hypothetical protein [Clostridia bacterium]